MKRRPRDGGSVSAELVICTPLLVLLTLVAVAIGRLVLQQSQVVDVARVAAEAASVWPTPPQAGYAALLTASYELVHDDLRCVAPVVSVDTEGQSLPGGHVSVSVTCVVLLSSSGLPGLPGSVTLHASATAPVEQYREAMSTARKRARDDVGLVAAYIVLFMSTVAVLFGLAFDGGLALSARQAAFAEAEQAARAGAAALSTAALRGGSIAPSTSVAVAAAEAYMAEAGHPGTATVRGDDVVATVAPFLVATPLLALVGIPSLSVSATAAASALSG